MKMWIATTCIIIAAFYVCSEFSLEVNAGNPYDCILDVTTCRNNRDCPGRYRSCINGRCCRTRRETSRCPFSRRGPRCRRPTRACDPGYTCRGGYCCRECPQGMSYVAMCFSGGSCLGDYQCIDGNCCKNDN